MQKKVDISNGKGERDMNRYKHKVLTPHEDVDHCRSASDGTD